uniref:TPX2 central domain-containing protein n=1 Tax=Kalanchoe fedtschenkoi TaxID=63787 RepID=A0A7N0VBS6_KALFE
MSVGLASPKSTAKKTMTLSKGSTLMKPTASHLAKLNHRKEVSKTLRPQKQCVKGIEKSLRNSVIQDQATKRQKLEIGYLRKAAQLNHQTSFSHKKSIEVAHLDRRSVDVKKVTIPREPKLETARRALIRSYKCRDAAEQDCDTKSSTHSFKALPLNKKILQSPSLPFRKKTAPLTPEFQEFRFITSERAMEHSSENVCVGIPFYVSAVNIYIDIIRISLVMC